MNIYVNNEGLTVFSPFDGVSCGMVALKRKQIKVKRYLASEIDKYAIKVSKNNHPEIEQLGNIENWRSWSIDWSSINLMMGGSPCQGFSVAGKRLNFDDPRSRLFLVYLDIWKHVKKKNPNAKFLLENVVMDTQCALEISKLLECSPVLINSDLVSAQNRERLYWTNISGTGKDLFGNIIEQPEDKGIFLKDIIHEKTKDDVDLTTYMVPIDKTFRILDAEATKGKIGYFRKDCQANRVYSIHGKSVTLCGEAGGGAVKMGQYLFGCITPDRIDKRQNGQRFSDGNKFYTLTAQDKHGILIDGYIRRLTPIECERLQTLPDNYTAGVSDTQRYKMLGNGWTVDVIAHILQGLEKDGLA